MIGPLLSAIVTLSVGGLMVRAEPGTAQPSHLLQPVKMMSVPVSPSVVATVATSQGRLVMLVLWRGAPGWHSSGPQRSAGGGTQNGRITVMLQYGDTHLDLAFDSASHEVSIQKKVMAIPRGTNVLLVDGVDGVDAARGGVLTTVLTIDPTGVDVDPRLGLPGLVSVLDRSREVVDFLQCDAVPSNPRSVEPCHYLKTR